MGSIIAAALYCRLQPAEIRTYFDNLKAGFYADGYGTKTQKKFSFPIKEGIGSPGHDLYLMCKHIIYDGYRRILHSREYGEDYHDHRHSCFTFRELFEATHKKLTLTAVNTTTDKLVYFNHETHPEMEIAVAMRASSGFPVAFKPVIYDNQAFIDGGLMANCPVEEPIQHSSKTTLALTLHKGEYSGLHTPETSDPKGKTFLRDGFATCLNLNRANYRQKIEVMTGEAIYNEKIYFLPIPTGSVKALDFKMGASTKEALWRSGATAVGFWLQSPEAENCKLTNEVVTLLTMKINTIPKELLSPKRGFRFIYRGIWQGMLKENPSLATHFETSALKNIIGKDRLPVQALHARLPQPFPIN